MYTVHNLVHFFNARMHTYSCRLKCINISCEFNAYKMFKKKKIKILKMYKNLSICVDNEELF